MKIIYKYSLEITDEQIIRMPKDSKILCVQNQNGVPCIWALIDLDKKESSITILLKGTGRPFEDVTDKDYIGTTQDMYGALIWHWFVKKS